MKKIRLKFLNMIYWFYNTRCSIEFLKNTVIKNESECVKNATEILTLKCRVEFLERELKRSVDYLAGIMEYLDVEGIKVYLPDPQFLQQPPMIGKIDIRKKSKSKI